MIPASWTNWKVTGRHKSLAQTRERSIAPLADSLYARAIVDALLNRWQKLRAALTPGLGPLINIDSYCEVLGRLSAPCHRAGNVLYLCSSSLAYLFGVELSEHGDQ